MTRTKTHYSGAEYSDLLQQTDNPDPFKQATTAYTVHDHSDIDSMRTWCMTRDNSARLIETQLGVTVTYTVTITDCVNPESFRTDHRKRFLDQHGDSVTEVTE